MPSKLGILHPDFPLRSENVQISKPEAREEPSRSGCRTARRIRRQYPGDEKKYDLSEVADQTRNLHLKVLHKVKGGNIMDGAQLALWESDIFNSTELKVILIIRFS